MTTASAAAQDTAATLPQARIAKLPAAFFGAVLGLVGLGLAWRSAVHVFGVPPFIGELILALGAAAFVFLAAFYIAKILRAPAAVLAELMTKDGEMVPTNNEISTFVSVLSGGLNVLFLQGPNSSFDYKYLGGAICPGVTISADALFQRAARLPRIDVRKPSRVVGRTTVGAMESGLFWGYVGMVEGLVRRMSDELGGNAVCIATGGLADVIAPETPLIQHVDADLTLHGLRIVWERNQ